MSIGKVHLTVFLIGFLLSGCAISEIENGRSNPEEAWWVSKEFKTTESDKATLILEFNPDWKLALVFDMEYMSHQLNDAQYKNLQKFPLAFRVESNLDDKLPKETFVVGVYESYSGEKGRFIAIKQNSKIIKTFTHSGFSGYSSIYIQDEEVRWYKCMECNDYDLIRWSGSDYVLQ